MLDVLDTPELRSLKVESLEGFGYVVGMDRRGGMLGVIECNVVMRNMLHSYVKHELFSSVNVSFIRYISKLRL